MTYNFLQDKTAKISFDNYLNSSEQPCFVVNHLAHIYFIHQNLNHISQSYMKRLGHTPQLCIISPINAVSYLGVRWWIAFVERSRYLLNQIPLRNILDCYDHAGFAMAALRLGQKEIIFKSDTKQYLTIVNRAKCLDAVVLDIPPVSHNLLNLKFKKKEEIE